jgi:hypothetical protein
VERRRIGLLGATGYTGQRVLRELLTRGEEPTLVRRNRSRCWPWPIASKRASGGRGECHLDGRPHPAPGAKRTGKPVRTFRYACTKRAALTVTGSEHLGLPEVFSQLESIDVRMGWFGRWTRPVRAVTRVTVPLLRSAKARAAVKRLSKRLPGSHREPDSDGRCLVIAAGPLGRTTAMTGQA